MISWLIIMASVILLVLIVMVGTMLGTLRYLIECNNHVQSRLVDLQITISNNKYSNQRSKDD